MEKGTPLSLPYLVAHSRHMSDPQEAGELKAAKAATRAAKAAAWAQARVGAVEAAERAKAGDETPPARPPRAAPAATTPPRLAAPDRSSPASPPRANGSSRLRTGWSLAADGASPPRRKQPPLSERIDTVLSSEPEPGPSPGKAAAAAALRRVAEAKARADARASARATTPAEAAKSLLVRDVETAYAARQASAPFGLPMGSVRALKRHLAYVRARARGADPAAAVAAMDAATSSRGPSPSAAVPPAVGRPSAEAPRAVEARRWGGGWAWGCAVGIVVLGVLRPRRAWA